MSLVFVFFGYKHRGTKELPYPTWQAERKCKQQVSKVITMPSNSPIQEQVLENLHILGNHVQTIPTISQI